MNYDLITHIKMLFILHAISYCLVVFGISDFVNR